MMNRSAVVRLQLALVVATTVAATQTSAQPNDDCANATVVAPLPFADALDTSLATSPASDPLQLLCGIGIAGNSVWYEFTAPRTGTYAINSHGSDYDTAVSLYSGDCATPVETQCSQSLPDGSGQNAIRVDMTRNQTVLIKVTDALGGGGGDLGVAVDRVMALEPALVSGTPSPSGGALSWLIHPHLPRDGRGRTMVFEGATEGMFLRHPLGPLITIAVSGDTAPGTGGGTFRNFGPPDINDNGILVFHATVDNGTSSEGIFRWDGGSLSAVVLHGQSSPMLLNYDSFYDRPDINNADDIAFAAQVGSGLSGTVQQGIFLANATSGATSRVVTTLDTDPCTGSAFRDLARRGASITDAGDVAFTNGNGLYIATSIAGPIQALVCENDPAPGGAVGALFRAIGKHPTMLNSSPLAVVFQTRLINPTLDALYLYSPTLCTTPPICPLAIENDVAPGGTGTFSRLFPDMVADIALSGRIAFQAVTSLGGFGVRHIFRADPTLGTLDVEATVGSPCTIGAASDLIRPGRAVSVEENTEQVAYSAQCNAGRGIQSEPFLGVASEVASRLDVTTVGNGFEFLDPSIDAVGGVAFRGVRRSVYSADCSSTPCTINSPAIASPLDLAGGMSGSIDDIMLGMVDGDDGVTSLVVRSGRVGAPRGDAILIAQGGTLTKVVQDGDPIPGFPGATFLQVATSQPAPISQPRPIVRNQVMAFLADFYDAVGMPRKGIFWADLNTLAITPIALQEQPSPTGTGLYLNFSNPAASSRDVVFIATTQLAWCAYRYRTTSGVLDTMLCTGDPVAAPVGGTVQNFVGAPSFESGRRVVVRVNVSGGTSSECYVEGRRNNARALACLGDPVPVGGVIDSYDFSGELYVNPLRRRQFAFYSSVDHFGNTSYTALSAGRIRRSQLNPLRAAAENEPSPLGGRFGEFDDFTPLGMSIEGRRLAFNAYILDGPVGQAIFFGDIR